MALLTRKSRRVTSPSDVPVPIHFFIVFFIVVSG